LHLHARGAGCEAERVGAAGEAPVFRNCNEYSQTR
jgi:hypothetical protein